jgi:hypothetical protein
MRTLGEAEATYERILPELQLWVGCFALVRDSQLGGVFSNYDEAARAWMAMYGPVPALIRRIERLPTAIVGAADAPMSPPAMTPKPATTGGATQADVAEAQRRMTPFSKRAFAATPMASTSRCAA